MTSTPVDVKAQKIAIATDATCQSFWPLQSLYFVIDDNTNETARNLHIIDC